MGDYVTSDYPTVISQIIDENGNAVFAVTKLGKWRVYNSYTKEYEIVNIEDYIEYTVNMHVATLTVNFDTVYSGNLCTITGNSVRGKMIYLLDIYSCCRSTGLSADTTSFYINRHAVYN